MTIFWMVKKAEPFEIWTNDCQFVKKPIEILTKMSRFRMVQFLNGLVTMVGTLATALANQPLKTRPFEIQSSKILDSKCFQISIGQYSNHLNTRLIWYSNGSPVVKWSSIQMVIWKPVWKKPVMEFEWSPSQVTLPFGYRTPISSGFSDESSIQVLGIQMVTAFRFSLYVCYWGSLVLRSRKSYLTSKGQLFIGTCYLEVSYLDRAWTYLVDISHDGIAEKENTFAFQYSKNVLWSKHFVWSSSVVVSSLWLCGFFFCCAGPSVAEVDLFFAYMAKGSGPTLSIGLGCGRALL